MSLILEALKKSEQQRHLGEAPNLGTPIVLGLVWFSYVYLDRYLPSL